MVLGRRRWQRALGRRSWPLALVTVVAAAVGLVSMPPAQAAVTGGITDPAGMCVDVGGGSNANGTPVQLWGCNGTGAQQWTTQPDGTVRALGKCLDVSGGGTAIGTRVQLWDCNGGSAQTWARSNLALINPASGRCLDAAGGNIAAGTPLQIWDCNWGGAQQWTLPAGSDVLAFGGNDAKTLQSTVSGAASFDIRCVQHRDGPTVVGGDIVGSAHTDCDFPVTEMQILVELFVNGVPVGSYGHDQGFQTKVVQGWAQATCVPGSWVVYAQTLVVSPPGYIPPDVLIYPSPDTLHPTVVSPSDCLPVILNMSDGDARNKVAQLGLRVGTVTHQASHAPFNSVISWSLEADGITIDLVEALGDVTVPNLVGFDQRSAARFLQSSGLVMGSISQNNYDDVPAGIIAAQNPAPGSTVARGSEVGIAVSLGPEVGGGGGGCFIVC